MANDFVWTSKEYCDLHDHSCFDYTMDNDFFRENRIFAIFE